MFILILTRLKHQGCERTNYAFEGRYYTSGQEHNLFPTLIFAITKICPQGKEEKSVQGMDFFKI